MCLSARHTPDLLEAPDPAQSHVQLAVTENAFREDEAELLKGLALRFVDCHAESQTYWELTAAQNKRQFRILRRELDAGNVDSLALGTAGEKHYIQHSWVASFDDGPRPIANTCLE